MIVFTDCSILRMTKGVVFYRSRCLCCLFSFLLTFLKACLMITFEFSDVKTVGKHYDFASPFRANYLWFSTSYFQHFNPYFQSSKHHVFQKEKKTRIKYFSILYKKCIDRSRFRYDSWVVLLVSKQLKIVWGCNSPHLFKFF